MEWDKILAFFTKKEVIIGLFAALFLMIVLLVIRKSKVKRFRKQLMDYQVKYNSLKSVPLTFKLNKAIALARVDEQALETVNSFKDDYDLIHAHLKQIMQLLTEMEENTLTGELKALKLNVIDLDGIIDRTENDVSQLDKQLDGVLKQEVEQRDEINQYKERFREIKNSINEKRGQLAFSEEMIEEREKAIEKLFTAFEELMYASEFQKAKERMDELDLELRGLEGIIQELPELLMIARGVIPKQIDQITESYSHCKQKGVYLQHLDVAKNLEVITETLKQDLSQLRNGEIVSVKEHLEDYQTRLQQLLAQIEREDKSFDELQTTRKPIFDKVVEGKQLLDHVREIYEKASVRYGVENIDEQLSEFEQQFADFAVMKEKLETLVNEYSIPASTIILSLKEFNQSVSGAFDRLKELKDSLDVVRTDEERVKKQLLKLHLIMNEIQVKVQKHHLPAISNDYEGDRRRSYEYIDTLEKLLDEVPLNVNLMNSTLSEAIDYIYRHYNNVNNIVGMALMVENTIVFGNKYRSSHPDLDSELTRSELYFRNGEYTQALTVAINAIEKIDIESYEELIKENAASAA